MQQRSSGPLIYAAVMLVVLVAFVFLGDNGVVYLTVLFGVPIASGLLAGLQRIRFWHAVIGCLAVVVLDLVFEESWLRGLVFFAVLGVFMVGIAALARFVTRWVAKRRGDG